MFIMILTYEDSNSRTYISTSVFVCVASLYTSANQEQLCKPEFRYNDLVKHLKTQ